MSQQRESLLVELRKANQRLAISALVLAGIALTFISFVTLRVYVDQNLKLVARSMAFTSQAAVVFRDAAAAKETLTLIAEQENVSEAQLFDAKNQPIAQYVNAKSSRVTALLSRFEFLARLNTTSLPIDYEGKTVGSVTVSGDMGVYLRLLFEILVTMVVCLALIGLMGTRLSRWLEQAIVHPLERLADVTHAARLTRNFEMRAPPADILEINALSEDFNALMTEMQGHEKELLARQKRLQAANDSLSPQAFHDGLTGLPNRTNFLGRLGNALAANSGDTLIAVMYIDCDYFKQINDSLGHAVGDEVLVEFSRRLRMNLRESDSVARLGGDEFGAMLSPLRTVGDARHIAGKMIEALSVPIPTQSAGLVNCSATIGVAVFPYHGDTLDGLLRCADAVMYRAKGRERGTFLVAEECDVEASELAALE